MPGSGGSRKLTSESIEKEVTKQSEPQSKSGKTNAKPGEQGAQTIVKKKRNKKKTSKLTDTDILNNFMKSLHSQPEEEPAVKQAAQNKKRPEKKRPVDATL